MYLDRDTRIEFETLSLKVFGIKSKYQTLLNKGQVLRNVGPGVHSKAKPLKSSIMKYYTLETLKAFLLEESNKIDQTFIRKI